MSRLTALEQLGKAKAVTGSLAANPQVFANPSPPLALVNTAIADLEAALIGAADGSRSKTALAHSKQAALLKLMNDLANYVQAVANGDKLVVYMAGLDVKKTSSFNKPDFSVKQGPTSGSVLLTVRAHAKTLYKWQYCKDPAGTNGWTDIGYTSVCHSGISQLQPGLYWFRVIFLDDKGEHEGEPRMFAVN